jgi:thiol-disulfide isomerase/thioredoxin
VWDLPNESPKGEHAWNLIITQKAGEASAAILRVDGDTGTLKGRFNDGKWTLNHFDGARASVLEIVPNADGTLAVDLKGFHNPTKHFTAVRLEDAKAKGIPLPTDPDEHTRVKDWNEPLRFSFPDLNGKMVSNTDERFKGKVVIVNVTGSWCPNCHDEAPFLASLYRQYHARGLEIVALDFEEPEQRKDPTRLQAFIKKYRIEYTYLLAGEPSELQAKIPQAENLNSWPTTFFLGRDSKVKAIHAGFAGAASGPFNAALKKEVSERIKTLLRDSRKTAAVSSATPKGLASSFPDRWGAQPRLLGFCPKRIVRRDNPASRKAPDACRTLDNRRL